MNKVKLTNEHHEKLKLFSVYRNSAMALFEKAEKGTIPAPEHINLLRSALFQQSEAITTLLYLLADFVED